MMDKKRYIEEVSDFIDYFEKLINKKKFHHQFQLPAQSKNNNQVHNQTGIYEGFEEILETDRKLTFNSLEDAYKRYWWNKKNYKENKKILDELKNKIKVFHNKEDRDPNECYELVKAVFDWGGVWKARNEKHVNKIPKKDLLQQIEDGINEMGSQKPNLDVFDKKRSRMNAGYTKYYSLACEDVIIYDGRVGAALGLIARKFCEDRNKDKVPSGLNFRWGPAQNSEINRDPSENNYKFIKFNANDRKHAESNIRANWIIVEALKRAKRKKPDITWAADEEIDIRMIEAALFTMGYSL